MTHFVVCPTDVFCFTMIQELVARCIDVEVGPYQHFVASMHLYESDQERVRQYLEEGFLSTIRHMPEMPIGNPEAGVRQLLAAEQAIRSGQTVNLADLNVDTYWADLIRLLLIFRHYKSKSNSSEVAELCNQIDPCYKPYIDRVRMQLS